MYRQPDCKRRNIKNKFDLITGVLLIGFMIPLAFTTGKGV